MKARTVGELISCTSDLYPQLEWLKKLKRLLWTQKLKKKKNEEGIKTRHPY
jgi:hypothetical protein